MMAMKQSAMQLKAFTLIALAWLLSACQTTNKQTACEPVKQAPVLTTPAVVAKPVETTAPKPKPTAPAKPVHRYTMDEVKGVYAAILPCADCLGIETLLTLNGDGQYILHETYENLDKSAFDSYGRWVIAGGQIIVLIPAQAGQTAYQFAIDSKQHISMLGVGGAHPNDARYVLKRR